MAKVRARPDTKKLYFDFHYLSERCREYSALDDVPANRRKMEKVMAKIQSEIELGTFDYGRYFPTSKMVARFKPAKPLPEAEPMYLPREALNAAAAPQTFPTFEEFSTQWRNEKQVEWRLSYRDAIDSIFTAHLLPAFGATPIDQIDRAKVLSFRSTLAQKKIGECVERDLPGRTTSPATVNRVMGILRMFLDEAAVRHRIQNPCTSIKRLKLQRKDIEPFSLDEVKAIIARGRADYQPYFTFRFFTGVRSGEAHGLRWKHVDFERRQILIRETFQNGRVEYTKTDGSQRSVHMSPVVHDALMAMRPTVDEGDTSSIAEGYVFRTRNGLPIDNNNFNDRVWKPLLRNLGLKYRRPYEMRHTCATLWLAAGESPEWIARQLGHTTTEMLFRTYSRYVPNLMRRDGCAFDTLVSGVVNGGITAANDDFLKFGQKPKRAARSNNNG